MAGPTYWPNQTTPRCECFMVDTPDGPGCPRCGVLESVRETGAPWLVDDDPWR